VRRHRGGPATLRGIARFSRRFDDRGREVEMACFGTNGLPCDDATLGYARRERDFDEDDREVETRYFAASGQRLGVEVKVQQVDRGSQAERLGLQAGDVLLDLGGRPITCASQFWGAVRAVKELTPLRVRRGEQTLTLQLRPGPLRITLEERIEPAKDRR
jgi:S1-C subfamily serine protease